MSARGGQSIIFTSSEGLCGNCGMGCTTAAVTDLQISVTDKAEGALPLSPGLYCKSRYYLQRLCLLGVPECVWISLRDVSHDSICPIQRFGRDRFCPAADFSPATRSSPTTRNHTIQGP